MGYYAYGSGDIDFKPGTTRKDMEDALDAAGIDLYGFELDFYEYKNPDGSIVPSVSIADIDDNWHEEDVYDLFRAFEPLVSNGQLEYRGEDDSHWAYRFDPVSRKWEEINGILVYGDDLAALDEGLLVRELEKRGYAVSKAA